MNILLVNQYAGNKGDRAVLYATCRMLKKLYPLSKITVSTSDRNLWNSYSYYADEGIEFIPWSWDFEDISCEKATHSKYYWQFLNRFKKYTFTLHRESFLRNINLNKWLCNPNFYRYLCEADLVISVGGHHFTTLLSKDLVSDINYDAISVLNQKKLICFSQSFGPFDFFNKSNRKVTQKILTKAHLLPRDKFSKIQLKHLLGNIPEDKATYESVFSLASSINYIPVDQRDKIIGISIYSTKKRNMHEKLRYIEQIAEFCQTVIIHGYTIKFFPMEIKGSEPDDRPLISEIISSVGKPSKCFVYDQDLNTIEHLLEVSKCKIFLAHKTHSVIFALITGTPVIAISYHPKTKDFMQQFKMGKYVIDDKKLNHDSLSTLLMEMENNLKDVSLQEFEQAKTFGYSVIDDLETSINHILK